MYRITDSQGVTRKLSVPRLSILIVVLSVVAAWGYAQARFGDATVSTEPWFAPYVDVTATPTFSFQQMGTLDQEVNAVLSFIVSLPSEPCTPAWGAAYTLDQANAGLTLDTRIARLRERGGSIVVSFGGRDNQELATGCTDGEKLLTAYQQVVDRYDVDTIDLDLENEALNNVDSNQRRAEAISKLQAKRREAGKPLSVWLTLPVSPAGLTEAGTTTVSAFLDAKVDLAGVNVMTMNYGQSLVGNSMLESSKQALTNTHRQLGILYDRAGISLRSTTIWSKLGATPMIGQNDLDGEAFSLNDAEQLNAFGIDNGLGRMSMWSANRDVACGSSYANLARVSDSCSGLTQEREAFMQTLGKQFTGAISDSAQRVTMSEVTEQTNEIVDDPEHSPYQIWTKAGVYVQGTRVVWKKNVYQAKWWTQGEVPDNPVLQTWETPWELIGPVLPGDTPIAQPTLPAGTYPLWSGADVYNAGQRVLLDGVPYQAKWWTQGDSPAAAASNPNSSPWIPLTQAQINEILDKK